MKSSFNGLDEKLRALGLKGTPNVTRPITKPRVPASGMHEANPASVIRVRKTLANAPVNDEGDDSRREQVQRQEGVAQGV